MPLQCIPMNINACNSLQLHLKAPMRHISETKKKFNIKVTRERQIGRRPQITIAFCMLQLLYISLPNWRAKLIFPNFGSDFTAYCNLIVQPHASHYLNALHATTYAQFLCVNKMNKTEKRNQNTFHSEIFLEYVVHMHNSKSLSNLVNLLCFFIYHVS